MIRKFIKFVAEKIDEVKSLFWREVRCEECGALLFHEYVVWGRILVKCYKCNHFNFVSFRTTKNGLHRVIEEEAAGYNPKNDTFLQTVLESNNQDVH